MERLEEILDAITTVAIHCPDLQYEIFASAMIELKNNKDLSIKNAIGLGMKEWDSVPSVNLNKIYTKNEIPEQDPEFNNKSVDVLIKTDLYDIITGYYDGKSKSWEFYDYEYDPHYTQFVWMYIPKAFNEKII
jgi:hypothetical protein